MAISAQNIWTHIKNLNKDSGFLKQAPCLLKHLWSGLVGVLRSYYRELNLTMKIRVPFKGSVKGLSIRAPILE